MSLAIKPTNPRRRRGRAPLIAGAWPLADKGSPTRDLVARNDLTFNGGASWTVGPDGPAVSFDGAAGSFLRPLASLGINPATQDFSIAGWFLATAWNSSNSTFFAQEDGAGTGRSWAFATSAGQLATNLNGAQTIAGALTLNTWYHVAVVCLAGKTWTVYLNGVPVISLSGTQSSNLGNLRVGNWKLATAGGGLIGSVGRSGVVVQRRAVDASEVRRSAWDPHWLYRPGTRWVDLAATGGVVFVGVGGPTLGPLGASGAATRAVPVFGGVGGPALGSLGAAGAGFGTVPVFVGAGGPALGPLVGSGVGLGTVAVVAGSGSPALGPLWVVATASAQAGPPRYVPTQIYANVVPLTTGGPAVANVRVRPL